MSKHNSKIYPELHAHCLHEHPDDGDQAAADLIVLLLPQDLLRWQCVGGTFPESDGLTVCHNSNAPETCAALYQLLHTAFRGNEGTGLG